jgi:hypothetical protein
MTKAGKYIEDQVLYVYLYALPYRGIALFAGWPLLKFGFCSSLQAHIETCVADSASTHCSTAGGVRRLNGQS